MTSFSSLPDDEEEDEEDEEDDHEQKQLSQGACIRVTVGGVPREQKMLKGHLPRIIYHRVY